MEFNWPRYGSKDAFRKDLRAVNPLGVLGWTVQTYQEFLFRRQATVSSLEKHHTVNSKYAYKVKNSYSKKGSQINIKIC